MKKTITILGTALLAVSAQATMFLSHGPLQGALAGGGSAAPQDSSWIKMNPAGLVYVEDRLDYSIEGVFPTRTLSSSAAVSNPFVRNQENTSPSFLPNSTYVKKIDEDSTFALGFLTTSGIMTKYDSPRTVFGALGNYDRQIDYSVFKLSAIYAQKFDNGFSFAIGPNLNYSRARTNLANLLSPTGAQTSGGNQWDSAWGAGFQVAVMQQWEKLALSVSWTSRQWMQTFDKYRDVTLGPLDQPNVLQVGLAYKLNKELTWTMDYQLFNWKDVRALSATIEQGGFGWSNHHFYKTGLIWQATEDLKLLAGYSYAKAMTGPEDVYANAFSPIITEHFLSCGASYDIDEHWEVNGSYIHGFENHITSDGKNALIHPTQVGVALDILTFSVAYKF